MAYAVDFGGSICYHYYMIEYEGINNIFKVLPTFLAENSVIILKNMELSLLYYSGYYGLELYMRSVLMTY